MTSFRGQANWAKTTSPWGKPTALACHPTKKVNKALELIYLSINTELCFIGMSLDWCVFLEKYFFLMEK
jgi:hypothetical protein